ncbi:cell division cycle protein-like [Tropilaelaps mercedesae]|uniref:Cell division cycle protein-like n=1 Tax=Tropilaelaps mercedesae TaxID=418985 RepID=A0A1V9X3V4_9ACAR|nr:cell division cycle protein-like [Tropilaelaps mercedesae]
MSFFKEYIEDHFALENYVFDVYRSRKDYVRLLDFNPFCAQTDGLLFDWSELDELEVDNDQPEFRYHANGVSLRPSNYREYSLPTDVHLFANASSAKRLIDLMKIHDVQSPNVSRNGPHRTPNATESNKNTKSCCERNRHDSTSSSSSGASSKG